MKMNCLFLMSEIVCRASAGDGDGASEESGDWTYQHMARRPYGMHSSVGMVAGERTSY